MINNSDIGKEIHGFRVLSVTHVGEIAADMIEAEHMKSGAQLVWLDRDDENKSFCIAFPTIPDNDTGVFHILEHSVLGGSDRYPVKEPFLEMMKSSMQTFLNALTYPDKTVFPVSSRNDKDFMNLVRVYMDAVLHPSIYHKPEIFMQEGWHYEFPEDGGAPVYKGVVFNEMKGAFASADTVLENEIARRLFPDCCYSYVSGGDPAHIPELTYEQFLDYHKRFYNPTSGYIVLDGKMDIDAVLGMLNDEFLSDYDRAASAAKTPVQPAVDGGLSTVYYELPPEEPKEKKARYAFASVPYLADERVDTVAAQVLSNVLCGSQQSPLKRRILEEKLGEDVRMGLIAEIAIPYFCLEVKNIDESSTDRLKEVLHDEIERLCREGIDKELLASSISSLEFSMKERDFGFAPQGVGFCISVVDGLYYNHDAKYNLEFDDIFKRLYACAEGDYFEKLLAALVQSPHRCEVLMLPSYEEGERLKAAEDERLALAVSRMSEEERLACRAAGERLIEWQNAEEAPEAAATLPHLQLSDISPIPSFTETREMTVGGIPVIRQSIGSPEIVYCRLYFNISDIPAAELPPLGLLCAALGELDTDRYTALEIAKYSGLYLGSLNFSIEPYTQKDHPETCKNYLCVSFSAVRDKLCDASKLVLNIMTATKFDNQQSILETVWAVCADMENALVESGNDIAAARVFSGVSAAGAVNEHCEGFTFYRYVKKLRENFQSEADALTAKWRSQLDKIFVKSRLLAGISGGADDAVNTVTDIFAALPEGEKCGGCAVSPLGSAREGIIIPGDTSYAVMGGNLLNVCRKYEGCEPVISRIISLYYLWNVIRVQGGAYGTGAAAAESGNMLFYSYRDPDSAGSLKCYAETSRFLREFAQSGNDLTDIIVGAVAKTEPVLLPRRQAKVADDRYLRGVSFEDLCALRRRMLSITAEDIVKFADDLDRFVDQAGVCVVGSKEQIAAVEGLTVYSM